MRPRKLDCMEGEDRQAWRVIQGYVSAHMHSRLAALEGAIEVEDAQLVLQTARDFVSFSELARRLHEVINVGDSEQPYMGATHTMRSILEGLADCYTIKIKRQRRLPKVFGHASQQLRLVQEILDIMTPLQLEARFRQRDQRLVMSLSPIHAENELLHTLSRQSALRYAVTHTSEASVRALILSRELATEQIGLYITKDSLHLSFQIASQLVLPFGD